LTDRKKDRNQTGPDRCATGPAVVVAQIPAEERLRLQQIFRNGEPQKTGLDRSEPIFIGSLRLLCSTMDNVLVIQKLSYLTNIIVQISPGS
jgi:hypothetical protein